MSGPTGRDLSDARFAAWVQPSLPVLSRVATALVGRDDSEDVVQEALSRAWSRWSTFDESRGTPTAWLATITANQARQVRRRTRNQPPSSEADTLFFDETESVGADVDLRRAITALPQRQREAIYLCYYLDLDVRTIAKSLGISSGTVKSTLSDARANLLRILTEAEDA